MHISHLDLLNFRVYEKLSFSPDRRMNILFGKNAQGKTSILEAIYLLATSRSWRAGKDSEMIHWGAEQARVFAGIIREEQNDVDVEVILNRSEKKQVSVNTIRQTKLADLMGKINVVLIEPHDVDIVRGDPSTRRKFLNLEISQIQPQYCILMANYRKVLDQRNRLLREMMHSGHTNGVLNVLNEQLVSYGSRIIERRLAFLNNIASIAGVIHSQITEGGETLEIKYSTSMDISVTDRELTIEDFAERFRNRLEEVRSEEIRRGVTLAGPQRDDIIFTVNGIDARVYGSQGQQRSIALSLRLAELDVMEESAQEAPIVLLDDVMTDLDEDRRAHVFEMTWGRCQTFITAASRRSFDQEFITGSRIFDVSKGKVTVE